MLKITQIFCPIGQEFSAEKIAEKLHCSGREIRSWQIEQRSLDARRGEMHWSYTVWADVRNEEKYARAKDVKVGILEKYVLPDPVHAADRPVIIGFGPAGMFAGLILAECGARPLILERGKSVAERAQDVDAFFEQGILNEESNVQYGEGGAGTFSDGKLTTRNKNIRVSKVLAEFVEAGADPSIVYDHRPHLGTDQLRIIVPAIRQKIEKLGGEVRFSCRVDSLLVKNNAVIGVKTSQGDIACDRVILCAGHSASDTYEELLSQGIAIVQKDFAAGVRVEHPQKFIDDCTYGHYAGSPDLGHASYQLTAKTSTGRGVYSFCMCPGGVVVPASTLAGTLAVNGMSYSKRDGKNANSAVLVQIPRQDFDRGNPLDGFVFQKELEKKAYRYGYQAPCANIADYLKNQVSREPVIESSFPRGVVMEDMHTLFPGAVNAALAEGFQNFDHKIPGFIDKGIMVGMESRSSSPIRMPRNEDGQSVSVQGLYPCGEGAGYAGGIVSSAVDGIKQAEHVLKGLQEIV